MAYMSSLYVSRFEQERQAQHVYIAMIKQPAPSEIFRERVKTARELRQLKQSELADRAKLPPSSIAHFEAGARKPSFDTLRRLANALEVTTDYLLGRVDDPGLAEAGDPLYRDMGKLTGRDREIAKDFLEMLAKKAESKRK
ncbi:MAG TPA: helix-turn-helix transcriptional regulator [Stellaceae bacterium]|nr:helix-turn-helix transcriptional regulator [Stellaceae bacterium]